VLELLSRLVARAFDNLDSCQAVLLIMVSVTAIRNFAIVECLKIPSPIAFGVSVNAVTIAYDISKKWALWNRLVTSSLFSRPNGLSSRATAGQTDLIQSSVSWHTEKS
jgi:hypothetical protein